MSKKKVTTNTDKVNRRNKRITVLQIIVLVGAVIAFLFPVIKSVYFQNNNYQVISEFEETEHTEETLKVMEEKNKDITDESFYTEDPFTDTEVTYKKEHANVVGVLEVEELGEKYAVYDRTNKDVLAVGVGMLDGTHYPTGAISQTTVLTGHNGTHDATIFQNLDKLEEGDTFTFDNGLEILTYEIYSMEIVTPGETDKIKNTPDQNTMILITCHTPDVTKGLNTHRLIIHGKRVDTLPKAEKTLWETIKEFVMKNLKFIILLIVSMLIVLKVIRLLIPLLFTKEQEKWIVDLKKNAIDLYMMYIKELEEDESISFIGKVNTDESGRRERLDSLTGYREVIKDYVELGWRHITLNVEKDEEVFKKMTKKDRKTKETIDKFHEVRRILDRSMKDRLK